MKILVTGADGFIGSHLVELLLKSKHKVTALSMYNSHGSIGWLEEISAKATNNNLNIVSGDINDDIFCNKILRGKEVLINLASLISIPHSYANPRVHFNTNVQGVLNLAQSCLSNKVKKVIHISSSEVYGTADYVPMDELHPLKPQSPYSASKISAETIMRSYYYSFNLPVTILRLFNTYGPRQSIRAVIPNIIIQALSKNKTIFLGDTSPTRDFNYVVDSCNAIINSIKKTKNGEIYNFGSGKEISIKDLIKKICDLTDSHKKIMQKKKFLRPKNSEVFRLVSNSKKFFKITKFKPVYTFDEGIKLSIDWYRKNLSKFKNSQYFN